MATYAYDDDTSALAKAISQLLKHEGSLVDCFRDDEGSLIVVLETNEDTELMLKLL